jgi:hypothetical protein
MIHARVSAVVYRHRSMPIYSIGDQHSIGDQVDIGVNMEVHVLLFSDGSFGINRDAVHLIEHALEAALNTPVEKPVPIQEALPPGPRRIVL